MTGRQRPVVQLEQLPVGVLCWWLAGWEEGYVAGAAEAEAERYAVVDERARDLVRRVAAIPPRDVLEERRYPGDLGQRAQRVREDWARRDRAAAWPGDQRAAG